MPSSESPIMYTESSDLSPDMLSDMSSDLSPNLSDVDEVAFRPCVRFDQHAEMTKLFEFSTSGADIIRVDVMYCVIQTIDRTKAIGKLMEHVRPDIAVGIEHGILEYAMIKISVEKEDVVQFVQNIYNDKVHEIVMNLDPTNRIGNTMLVDSLHGGQINPRLVGFMAPHQMNPARWKRELDRHSVCEDILTNQKVTDIYKCYKCGDRKCTTTQMQTRSADEPATIFITCLTCYNTFTK
jgi:DNA-directed RNA polymerase subunit M/transcription elongation factor TFIIS